MTRDDGGMLVTAVGIFALVVGLTDIINRYLRPSMAKWLVLSGIVLVVLGVAILLTGWWDRQRASAEGDPHEGHDHGHGRRFSRIGWLLAAPIVFAIVVNPGALGSYAVGRQTNARDLASLDFDLEEHLRSHTYGGQAAELNISQVLIAVDDANQEALLAETPVRLEGFVVNQDLPADRFLLARILVGCCAGDGTPLAVEMAGYDGPPLDDDQWVRVTATLDLAATEAKRTAGEKYAEAVFEVENLEKIGVPTEPYLYPY